MKEIVRRFRPRQLIFFWIIYRAQLLPPNTPIPEYQRDNSLPPGTEPRRRAVVNDLGVTQSTTLGLNSLENLIIPIGILIFTSL